MPTSIRQRFHELQGRKALIPFITAGDPDLALTWQALKVLDENGADFIELGVPYSDPLADGPVIQAAATRALARGITFDQIVEGIQSLDLKAPLILFTYYNPILRQGVTAFMARIAAAGVSGLVVPDLPLEEAMSLVEAATQAGIEVILLVAPTSPPERMAKIAQVSRGFIYLVSTTGVTGMRSEMASRVEGLIAALRQETDLPIGVGFGISRPEQAQQVVAWGADAAIVGSAFVNALNEGGLVAIASLCQDLKAAIDNRTLQC